MRNLRRVSQAQLMAVKDAVRDTIQTMKKLFLVNSDVITQTLSGGGGVHETLAKIHRQEDGYHIEMKRLEKDLRFGFFSFIFANVKKAINFCFLLIYSELEVLVEDLRSNVINKKTRVSMADVERLGSLLSQSRSVIVVCPLHNMAGSLVVSIPLQ